MSAKVFCIGFHKTGTTTIAQALRTLGYRVTGPNGVNDPNIAQNVYEMAYKEAKRFDAFIDNPWPLLFREMDVVFPNSKFILLRRQTKPWITSIVRHFGTKETPMRQWIYGAASPLGNEDIYIKRYEAHNQEVLDYFEDRPNDLIVMDFSLGDGWQELCAFLDKDIPNEDFPHANKATEREAKQTVFTRVTRRILAMFGNGRN